MKKITLTVSLLVIIVMVSVSFRMTDLDPAYLQAFGYGSICVSGKGFPLKDRYDATQFDFRNGKFYIEAKTQFDLRVFLPEGKTYGDLMTDFLRRKPHAQDKRTDKVIWRIFASHDRNGNKIYEHFPPSPEEMLSEVTYTTSPKELCFSPLDEMDVSGWKTSGVAWSNENTNLSRMCYYWLFAAQPGWQLYIVHTVGYYTIYEGNDHYVVDAPICKALVEVK
ncbi:MAG: hypothetical protein ABSE72_11110 [Bacteroidales bacterium]|jgi:PAS domain-containing protein